MNLSSVLGFSGVRLAQTVVTMHFFLWPVVVYVFIFCFCPLFICPSLIDACILIHLLTYDPDKYIGPVQRRHKHNRTEMQLVLAMILLTNGSLRTITN